MIRLHVITLGLCQHCALHFLPGRLRRTSLRTSLSSCAETLVETMSRSLPDRKMVKPLSIGDRQNRISRSSCGSRIPPRLSLWRWKFVHLDGLWSASPCCKILAKGLRAHLMVARSRWVLASLSGGATWPLVAQLCGGRWSKHGHIIKTNKAAPC